MGINHPKLWLALADWLLHSRLDLSAADMANVLNAFSKVGLRHDELLAAFSEDVATPPRIGEAEAGWLSVALNAFGRLRYTPESSVFDALASRIVNEVSNLDAKSA